MSIEAFVDHAYRFVLRRPPDEPGYVRATQELANGTLSRSTLLHELAESDEFKALRALDDGIAHAAFARRNGIRPTGFTAPVVSDARAIEVPWVLSRLGREQRVLDVGYAFAEPAYLAALLGLGIPDLVGVDRTRLELRGMKTVIADARSLPFADRSFDVALCVSTLEHIGADTTVYGQSEPRDAEGMSRALAELRRVLDDDGRLLLTLPLGEPADYGWYVQLDLAGWEELFERSGFVLREYECYDLGRDGWHPAVPEASRLICAELRVGA